MRVDEAINDRLMGDALKRAIIRAFMADELTLVEIAAEFSCHLSYVKRICQPVQETRCRVRRRGVRQG